MSNPRGNEATLRKYEPKWRAGKTRTIRVPVALADQILEYAHRIDAGEDSSTGIDSHSLSQVIKDLESVVDTPRNNFSVKKRMLLESAINRLKSLVTSE